MTSAIQTLVIAVCDTGPLISVFQSDSVDIVQQLFERLHITSACALEVQQHGWSEALSRARNLFVTHNLASEELIQAENIARRIAAHPKSKSKSFNSHVGESEAMVLIQRPSFAGSVLLLDEVVARIIAVELGLHVSGFAGILLLAVSQGMLSADDVRKRLVHCQQQGTHYSAAFIERIYQAAKER